MNYNSIKDYCQHYIKYVELERDEEMSRQLQEIKSMPAKKREKAGRALLNMNGRDAGRGLGGSYLIKYVKKGGLPKTDLTSGDLVIVSDGKPTGKEPQATIVEKTNFSLTLSYKKKPASFLYKKGLRIDLFANDIPYQRMKAALDYLPSHEKLSDLVIGNSNIHFEQNNDGGEEIKNPNLNATQKDAVYYSLSSKNCFLVHGPPGTGKTTTLLEVIHQHILAGNKILATADSNTAVDNMVEKLSAQNINVMRIGNPARINKELINHSLDYIIKDEPDFQESQKLWDQVDEIKEQQKEFQFPGGQGRRGLSDEQIKSYAAKGVSKRGINTNKMKSLANWIKLQEKINQVIEEAKKLEIQALNKLISEKPVICATNSTAGADELSGYKFDVIIIDEATQAVAPSCLIPMIKGNKFIMAGDHKQLPPTVLSKKAEKELQVSLFEHFLEKYGDIIRIMLTIQYRMNEKIMEFSNENFYENRLIAHNSVKEHNLRDLSFSFSENITNRDLVNNVLIPEKPVIFFDTGKNNYEYRQKDATSYRNQQEAEIVKIIVENLLNMGINPRYIGIISPYNGQVDLLQNWFQNAEGLEIKSVDGFQGREKEIIIISFVRSNENGDIGFLKDYRRLNVAITRAKRKLIMIGNQELLSVNPFYKKLIEKYPVVNAHKSFNAL